MTHSSTLRAHSPVTGTYPVTVDYSWTVDDMIAAGTYDWQSPDINSETFPRTGQGVVDVVVRLFHFDDLMTSVEVLEQLRSRQFRPVNLSELLALGAQHPQLQRNMPIVALGSRWRSRNERYFVPVIWSRPSGRDLNLVRSDFRWDPFARFAAVPAS